MPTRNVVITDHQSDLIDRLVTSGRYQNASEVLREGLRLVEAEQDARQAKLAALRGAIEAGLADHAAGHLTRLDTDDEISAFVHDLVEGEIAAHASDTA